jgi:hypothetical protein
VLWQARAASRASSEILSAVVLARNEAFVSTGESHREAIAQGFSIDRTFSPLALIVENSELAPAVTAPESRQPEAPSTPASMKLAEPKALIAAANAKPSLDLRLVSFLVKTPRGRRMRFETIMVTDAKQ